MTWGNPPKFKSDVPKKGKVITPEQIAGKSEGSQQKALMVWVALNIPKYPQLKYLFHIPNGGTRNLREAVELKAQGVKAGVPDLFLPYAAGRKHIQDWADGHYHGLFIELKVHPNKPSKEQWEWMAALESYGYFTAVCYSWEEARDILIKYLKGKL